MQYENANDGRTDTEYPAHRYMTPVPLEERPQATAPVGEILCPVLGCDYTHESAQGLCGHIPNRNASRHHWSDVDVTAADLKELDSRGTHPDPAVNRLLGRRDSKHNPREGTETYVQTETVRAYLAAEGVPLEGVQAFYDARYGSVQIQPRPWMAPADYDRFVSLVGELDGLRRAGDTRFYCPPAFLDKLGPSELDVGLSGGSSNV